MRQWRLCEICSGPAEQHHIVSRGAGGKDEGWNIINLCRMHHSQCHQVGWVKFGRLYPRIYDKIVGARRLAGRPTESREHA